VQWRPGDRIYLYVVLPARVTKPPVAIYIYGHPSDTDRFQDDGWCQRTTSGGYAAVGLVPGTYWTALSRPADEGVVR